MESMTSRADPPHQARAEGPQLPTRADLDRATAVTAAAIADPASGPADIYRAAETEAAVLSAYWHVPGAQAELEAEP
jgi:hypothetical protein